MTLHVEKQRGSRGAEQRLVSMLEALDYVTVTVIAVPMPAPRGKDSASDDHMEFLASSGSEDDLANATWEDAEWQ
jgi:hypothetical protein